MNIIQRNFPALYKAYKLVAEPRAVRIILFAIYVVFLIAGSIVVTQLPKNFVEVISVNRVLMFGSFLILGGLLSAVSVLPGIWWLERCGLIALGTGMSIYLVIIIGINGSPVGVCVAIAFILFFILRYMETRPYKLAPRKN